MVCQRCQNREVSVHVKQNNNGVISEMHLCPKCAQQLKIGGLSHPLMVADFLQALINSKSLNVVKGPSLLLQGKCPSCGTTAEQIQEIGKMGCGKCYEYFAAQMDSLLRRIHDRGSHEGKIPQQRAVVLQEEADLEQLKNRLQECIKREAFEEAALLRDRIRDLAADRGQKTVATAQDLAQQTKEEDTP